MDLLIIQGVNRIMKKLLLIIFIIFLSSFSVMAKASNLPNCPGKSYSSSWNNCIGTLNYSNGDKYIGEYKNGGADGKGIYTHDGHRYIGEFKNDSLTGKGLMTYAGGDIFFGEVNDGARVNGRYFWENGDTYVGEWQNDLENGYGILTYSGGDIEEGIWKDGVFQYESKGSNNEELLPDCPSNVDVVWHNCFGIHTFTNDEWKGDKYVGEWKDDTLHGLGIYTFSKNSEWKGDKYVGEWKDTLLHGLGIYTFADGTSEEGVFKDDEFLYTSNDSSSKNNNSDGEETIPASSDGEETIPASSGSGFAITSDGYVVTNHHVIDGCQNVEIINRGQTIPATVVSFDVNNDIALLKSDFNPLHVFPLSRQNPYTLMEIYAAGYPFGYDISTPIKITEGIISSLAGLGNNFSRIQIDAAVQPGNSGGPIIDEKGNVVGVVVSKLDYDEMMEIYGVVPEGINFGIKSNVVINFLESNNINLIDINTKTLSKEKLGKTITNGTYYISCLMTLAQINEMKERRVLFSNLE